MAELRCEQCGMVLDGADDFGRSRVGYDEDGIPVSLTGLCLACCPSDELDTVPVPDIAGFREALGR